MTGRRVLGVVMVKSGPWQVVSDEWTRLTAHCSCEKTQGEKTGIRFQIKGTKCTTMSNDKAQMSNEA